MTTVVRNGWLLENVTEKEYWELEESEELEKLVKEVKDEQV